MRKGAIIGIIIALLAIGGGAAYFVMQDEEEVATTTTTSEQREVADEDETPGEATEGTEQNQPQDEEESSDVDQELTIDMRNYEFSVEEITASPGDTITLNLTNSGGEHNLFLDEFDVRSQTTNTGETTSVTFTVPKDASGSYEYYCNIGQHRQLGMVGTLNVN
ncbi:MAG: cupredoxin domain-containing protein [Candidatus Saccharibacteria bacterium]|nr:cupredoxin domain-containing protein [Candidatus Saccharibacteria bacterium]